MIAKWVKSAVFGPWATVFTDQWNLAWYNLP